MKRLGLWLAVAALWGCDDGGEAAADAGGADAMLAGDAAVADGAPAEAALPAAGLWYLNVRLAELGGFEVPFQMELTVDADPARISSLILRAVGDEGAVSDDLAEVGDLPIVEGAFSLPETALTLPEAFSPTGSDIDVAFALEAQIEAADALCGTVTGEVTTIEIVLEESTFAARPWGAQGASPPGACGEEGPQMFPRLEACPDLVAGMNTDFMTGGQARAFQLFLPADHDPAESWPLVVAFYGFTSSAESLLEQSTLDAFVDDRGFILIVPESYEGGALEWDSLIAGDSPDLALFDDLLRCAGEQLGADPARIYSAGISGGSFFANYLGLYRAEVVAATIAFSTGLLAPIPEAPPRPFLTTSGGPEDVAFDQDFVVLTDELNAALRGAGHGVVFCGHDAGHRWLPEFTPWALDFLFAHELGDPLAFVELPEAFPEFCAVLP